MKQELLPPYFALRIGGHICWNKNNNRANTEEDSAAILEGRKQVSKDGSVIHWTPMVEREIHGTQHDAVFNNNLLMIYGLAWNR